MPCRDLVSSNAMLSAYTRHGHLDDAKILFDSIVGPNLVAWNTMLSTYAQQGHLREARELFDAMPVSVAPEEACFALVLTSCSREGKLYNGRCCFTSMRYDFGVSPSRPHYCCMIDLLARSGHLEDCEKLILTMPFEPQALEWIALLSACSSHGDNESGARAAKSLTRFQHGAAYVLLANANIPKLTGIK
ncbi:hypothetical protein SELMODRAFT_117185 [Selaginella moellendorffii]|uniref:Pentacotripeptide-repeat region of PRORP domain-containing protein n=1 Tax=Selaginella moellendorffii TaxID=88036 RepID=D8SHK6_SELML|nr:hypothetical protein SELMODRAFT_117185 [Selaginella moellendorffii]